MELGSKIREARQHRNMTAAALAEASNLTKGFISQVESGKSNPSITSLRRIAAALGIPVASLVRSGDSSAAARLSSGPELLVARNLYLEKTGLSPVANEQTGTFAVASLSPEMVLKSVRTIAPAGEKDGMLVVLRGRVRLRQGQTDLIVDQGEVAAWNAMRPYVVENFGNAITSSLFLFIPEGSSEPELVSRVPDTRSLRGTQLSPAIAAEGPMRLVAMRAQRQAERGR